MCDEATIGPHGSGDRRGYTHKNRISIMNLLRIYSFNNKRLTSLPTEPALRDDQGPHQSSLRYSYKTEPLAQSNATVSPIGRRSVQFPGRMPIISKDAFQRRPHSSGRQGPSPFSPACWRSRTVVVSCQSIVAFRWFRGLTVVGLYIVICLQSDEIFADQAQRNCPL